MISVTAYLLDYTLLNHCKGNRSALARKMNVRRTDFNRIYDRCINGEGGSLIALESLLRYYCQDKLSLDEAFAGYEDETFSTTLSGAMPQECKLMTQMFHVQLTEDSKIADRKAQVLHSAEQFMTQLERAFCQNGCSPRGLCKDICPCQQLCQLIDQIKMLMDASANIMQPVVAEEVNSHAKN